MPTGPSRRGNEYGSEVPLSDWTETREREAPPAPQPQAGFTPGTMLADRYRIVAPLGKGGMGEVYRADDTKLGQAVALKFIHGAVSPQVLKRLYAEVRIGRQVSHPNVCRLYDVVEVAGQTFLAMEYVDGEDLASLLSRIGRLPPDKALDVARDLCAGLAAAHDKGVVHRDLKPANVMIDGRGRARLTDFGLAIAQEDVAHDASAGTPVYMSPEQLAGKEVTLRSDVYALGLVLFEMFTGRRYFDAKTLGDLRSQHNESRSARLASASRLLGGAIERVILQCLEQEPEQRPASAREVIAMLPGGDPLEAAVAAGETPSPEMVAAAGKLGDLAPGAAWVCLLAVIGGGVLNASLADRTAVIGKAPPPKPPEALAERAREILMRLGRGEEPADWAYSFEWDQAYLRYVAAHDPSRERWDKLRAAQPGPLLFFYRQSPRKLVAANRDGVISRDDPPSDVSGMAEVVLDARGRLASFFAVPPQVETGAGPWPQPDWTLLFRESGLDPGAFRATASRWAAPVDSDQKAAWEGSYPGEGGGPVRIEAAAYHGTPVWFEVLPPWARARRMSEADTLTATTPVAQTSVAILALAMPLGGILLARRNLRLGRGDRKGAFRVALFVFVAFGLARLLRADHVSSFADELWVVIKVFAYPSFWALLVWLLYMALEPFARRRWPHMLISWKRLLGGGLRDPLVGRDLLLGAVAGTALGTLYHVSALMPSWLGLAPPTPDVYVTGATLTSLRQASFRLFVNQFSAVLYALVFLFVLVLLRLIARRQWLAMTLWCVLMVGSLRVDYPLLEWSLGFLRAVAMLIVLTQGGLLSLVTCLFFYFSTFEVPFTLNLSAWYASRALPVAAAFLALAAYAFHTSLAGKPLLGRLED
jgi:serine/threonine-protein kinase